MAGQPPQMENWIKDLTGNCWLQKYDKIQNFHKGIIIFIIIVIFGDPYLKKQNNCCQQIVLGLWVVQVNAWSKHQVAILNIIEAS